MSVVISAIFFSFFNRGSINNCAACATFVAYVANICICSASIANLCAFCNFISNSKFPFSTGVSSGVCVSINTLARVSVSASFIACVCVSFIACACTCICFSFACDICNCVISDSFSRFFCSSMACVANTF